MHTARGDVCIDLTSHPVNKPSVFFSGDAHHLPFMDEQFEFVNFLEVIEHVENPSQCLREIYRVLKPTGTIIVSTPNPTHWRIILRHLLHKRTIPYKEHIASWGLSELEHLLNHVGFQIEKADYIQVPERERYEKRLHRIPDRLMHRFSLCHALTGRSIMVIARKK